MEQRCEYCSSRAWLSKFCVQIPRKIFESMLVQLGWQRVGDNWKCNFCRCGH